MKKSLVVLVATVTILMAVGAGACSKVQGTTPLPNEANINVSIDEFAATNNIAKEIEVPVDGVLIVTLGSNPTTGFSWTDAQIANPAVLEQTGNDMIAPEGGVVGAAGNQVFTFKALKAGTTQVRMDYSRPWEGGEKSVWTFELEVTVK
jgi:inhibitor of cysteine peptidase